MVQFHFAWALLGFACLFAVPAAAAPQEAAESASAYLQAAQNADGSWGAVPETRFVDTSEAVVALRAAGQKNAAYFAGIVWLENHAMTSVDAQARRIIALLPHGDDVSVDSDRLEASYSVTSFFGDGWGLAGVHGASALDTGLALQAWGEMGVPSSVTTEVLAATNFLLSSRTEGSDAGWQAALSAANSAGDPVTTAIVLRGFVAIQDVVTGHEAAGDLAASFLATTVTAASSPLVQAHAALALLRWTPGTTSADPLLSALESSQATDGSWESDPYVTAIALQALAAKLGLDTASFQENVVIADQGLRAALNMALGRNRVDAITRGDMLSLTDLDASEFGIEDLSGIEEAQNLQSINLLGNEIFDLTPLDGLPSLTEVLFATLCDPNGDGFIGVADAQFVLRAISLGTALTASEQFAADVAPLGSPDGLLTVADAVVIQRAAVGFNIAACEN